MGLKSAFMRLHLVTRILIVVAVIHLVGDLVSLVQYLSSARPATFGAAARDQDADALFLSLTLTGALRMVASSFDFIAFPAIVELLARILRELQSRRATA